MSINFHNPMATAKTSARPKQIMLRYSAYGVSTYLQKGSVSFLFISKIALAGVMLAWLATSALQLLPLLSSDSAVSSGTASVRLSTANTVPAIDSLPVIDIAALKSIPLFGVVAVNTVPVEAAPEPVKEESLEETQLNLSLKGLFTASTDGHGQAIIANGRKDELYQIDDEISGLSKVTLTAVFHDRVNLNNRGKAEVLYLYPENERIGNNTAAANTSSLSLASSDPSSRPNESVVSQLPAELLNDKRTKKLNEIIRVVRERDKSTGAMLGFRVLPGRDREGFEKSGLQVNDVITAIDGEPLTDLRSAMAIYRNKREATEVSLNVMRDDTEVTFNLNLNKLN